MAGRIRDFKKVNSSNEDLNRVQDSIEMVLGPVLGAQIIDGVRIQNVVLASGSPTQVVHKLNRRPNGWIIIKKNANADVWETASAAPLQSSTLSLQASAAVTIDLWVF